MKTPSRQFIVVILSFLSLWVTLAAPAQDRTVIGERAAVPISCTADVPSILCQKITAAFASLQYIPLVSQVEVVIADPVAFSKETDRLSTLHETRIKTLDSKVDGDTLVKLLNRKSTAFSSQSRAILMVLDDDKTIRSIQKVVVSTDLFRELDVNGKLATDKDNLVHLPLGDFSQERLDSWSKYIAGYVEGWYWGRFEVISQR